MSLPRPKAFILAQAIIVTALMFTPSAVWAQTKTVANSNPTNPHTAAPDASDPRQYLEVIDDPKAIDWAKARNQTTADRLTLDPRFETVRADVLKIVEATDRIAVPGYRNDGFIYNFWQDADHKQGLWRRTSWDSYLSDTPEWDIVLDFDALSAEDGKTWVYGGVDCLPPEETTCLVSLKEGGADSVVVREFDLKTKNWVEGGFHLPDGKQQVTWRDKDTLYVSREWTPGEMTPSGYPFVTRMLKRGQALDDAVEVHRGEPTDMVAMLSVLRDTDGTYVMDLAIRYPSFFETEYAFITERGPVVLPLPQSSTLIGYHEGQAIFQLKADWASKAGTAYAQGSLIAFDLDTALSDPDALEPTILFKPSATQALEDVSQTRTRFIANILSNVTGEMVSFAFDPASGWTQQRIDLPANSTLSAGSASSDSDYMFATVTGFLEPATLYRVNTVTGEAEAIKSSPARFDATGLKVEQRWATSKDGTRVPYFLVAREDIPLDGSTPTILYAYGGFEVSMTPSYAGAMGKVWLEKGGAYVLANIRGGGEFGPHWHQAGLKTNRQLIFDDFQAVAEHLIDTKVTSPRRLSIMGGSNGGLLMGVQMTQRPELWNAVVIQVPLLDMIRYTGINAGASWVGEYGDPADPEEGAFLRSISPYHNIKDGVAYPEPLIETSTRDDRVGPGHARKFAALMEDMGLPYYYYENMQGGHSAAANLAETAYRYAVEYTYLYRKIMD